MNQVMTTIAALAMAISACSSGSNVPKEFTNLRLVISQGNVSQDAQVTREFELDAHAKTATLTLVDATFDCQAQNAVTDAQLAEAASLLGDVSYEEVTTGSGCADGGNYLFVIDTEYYYIGDDPCASVPYNVISEPPAALLDYLRGLVEITLDPACEESYDALFSRSST